MIYSIGHGNKSIEDFLNELNAFGVRYLVDVRSVPASKFHPHFNRQELSDALRKAAVRYVYLGDKLGGLPDDESCYRDGKVSYEEVRRSAPFREGLERLIDADRQALELAVMCSESDPAECHRSKAIGEALNEQGIDMLHIISARQVKNQKTVMLESTGGKYGSRDLLGDALSLESRGKYR